MTTVVERIAFASARDLIAEAVAAGAALEDLEAEMLDRLTLSRDARDALWLFAWAAIERRDSCRSAPPWRPQARLVSGRGTLKRQRR